MAYGDNVFNDVLDSQGCVSRAKLANCTFARLKPGDYIRFSFFEEDSDGLGSYQGCVFTKVISVRMPKPIGLIIGKQDPGGVLAELPDGSRVEVLKYWQNSSNYSRWGYGGYDPSDRVIQYFRTACFPQFDSPKLNRVFIDVYSSDRRGELKDAMMKEQERRKYCQERREQEAQARAAAMRAARQCAAEEARRNAAVSDRELDNLFRGR